MKDVKSIGITILVAAFLALGPFILDSEKSFIFYFLFLTFCYIVLAQAWNLVAGYTGQVSLGTHAFFGLGAYTTAMIWHYDLTGVDYYFDPSTMIISGIVASIFALAIGIPLLSKLHGDYFSLGTLGFGEIIKVAFIKGKGLTGGPFGLVLPSGVYENMRPHYWTALFLAFASTAIIYLLTRSRIGLALVAIREDEMAASANGINILKYKVLALMISAFFAGICGSLFSFYLFHVSPEGFLILKWTLYPILMCVMGGSGSILGPVLGCFVMSAVFSLANIYFPSIHPIFSGIIIIIVMIYMPNGIINIGKGKGQSG